MTNARGHNVEPSTSWQTDGVAVHTYPNLLQGVAQATNQLLTTDDLATAINQTLAILGQVTHVDRVYIFEIHPHTETAEPAMSQWCEWARETVTAEIDNPQLQNLPFASVGMSRWYGALSDGHSCHGLVRDLSLPERQLLEPQGILSILVVPIPVNGNLWGFIGFDDCHSEHQWSPDESAVLMTMAAMIGSCITHRQTADALKQSQLRLEQITANVPGMIFQFLQRLDGSRSVLYASSGCQEIYELEPEAIQADFQMLSNLIHPDDREAYERSVANSAAKGEPWNWEGRIITPSGKLKWVQGTSRLEQQRNGDLFWDGVLVDITDRKQAEGGLRASEARLQSFFDATFEAVMIHDRGLILDVNSATEALLGYSKAELVNQSVLKITAPCSQPIIQIRAQFPCDDPLEVVGLKKDGTTFIAEISAKSISYQGRTARVVGIRDITVRKQAEDALRQSEARNRALLHAIPDLIFRLSREGIYLDCHAENANDLVVPARELIGKKVEEVLPAPLAQEIRQLMAQALSCRTIQTLEYQLPIDGTLRYWEARIVVCGEDEVLVIVRDITERNRAQEDRLLTAQRAREAAVRHRLLGEIALRIRQSLDLERILQTTVAEVRQFLECDRVFITHFDKRLQGNIAAESMAPKWGSVLEVLRGNSVYIRELQALFESDDLQVIDDTTQADISPLRTHYFGQYQVKACLAVPIMISDKKLFGVLVAHQCDRTRHWQPFEVDLLKALSTQVAIAVQQSQLYEQVQTLNTNLERQVEERTQELKQKYTELQELHRLKDIFLHAVSHDLRTPVLGWLMVLNNLLHRQESDGLSVGKSQELKVSQLNIEGSDESLQPCQPESIPVSRSVLERMMQSSDRQLRLINSLLEVHASEVAGVALQCDPIQLGELVRILVEDFEPLLAKNQATLMNLVPANLPLISADAGQLRRVFENLLNNALNHNPPGITIRLEAQVKEEMICCTVADNGVGMSQEMCDRLFQLYFRGKDAKNFSQGHRPYTGLGLGLYLCRQIITAHGGEIGVKSRPEQGTTFWFTLSVLL
ncbi:GAF domain-containing protein [Allocoleopsis franciscana]|uniref:histidine kinase n=1 Tax=Allocoleopsis franciscana PCC 7113 TaxID=1173027 RepID=K9WIQ5_9CYAN|nr:GAF domain-containing protein [Allocoleopsis franciscana]AFZ19649.1 PAS domain S-box [Allocoleopsis franciscana PCC 7113]